MNDAIHFLFDGDEIVRREGVPNLEVVVKPVRHRWSNSQLCFGIDSLDRLCQNVGSGMPEHVEAVGAGNVNALHDVTRLRLVCQITQFAVDSHRNDRLFAEQFEPRVRLSQSDAVGHVHSSIGQLQPSDKPLSVVVPKNPARGRVLEWAILGSNQ